MTDELPDLPRGWTTSSIGDLGFVGTGATPARGVARFYEGGTIPWVTSSVVNKSEVSEPTQYVTQTALDETNLTLYQPGTLLLAMYGEGKTRGRCSELKITAATNQALAAIVLEGSASGIRKWVQLALEKQYSDTRKLASGGVQPNLNLNLVRGIRIPLPPLAEKRLIIEALDSHLTRLDAATEGLKRVEANLKRYRASVLKAAVEGRLVPTEAELAKAGGRNYEAAMVLEERIRQERRHRWEEAELAKMAAKSQKPKDESWKRKYQEPPAPDISKLPALPEGWGWLSVETLSSKVVDGVHKKPDYVEHGIPFVTVRNLTAGPGISFEKLNYITREDHAEFIKRADPELNDLLISKDGTLGVVRAIRTQETFSIFVSVALIKPIFSDMTDYLEVAFQAPVVQKQLVPKGSGLLHIHLEDLRADAIPIPPLAEQMRIAAAAVALLSTADKIEADVRHQQQRITRLRQSILKWAFEGKLVDQDPNDEPASVLLERIQKERAADSQSSPKRGRPRKTTEKSA